MNESPIFQDDKNDNEVEVPPVVDVNIDEDDLGVSEVNLDDDDDIFKSARLEPEPMKVEPAETFSSRPVETSGGLTNVVLYCSVPPSQSSLKSNGSPGEEASRVPTEVLLRLYGASYYRAG